MRHLHQLFEKVVRFKRNFVEKKKQTPKTFSSGQQGKEANFKEGSPSYLLQASHQGLSERDACLFMAFKTGNSFSQTEFSEVEKLSEDLKGQLVLNLTGALDLARSDPLLLSTTLGIIEFEEQKDTAWQATGFFPLGRPRRWRQMALDTLESVVSARLQGLEFEVRSLENPMWHVRYLEIMRRGILEDLCLVQSHLAPAFPPSCNIVETYVKWVHNCLRKLLEKNIVPKLEGYELSSLLAWVLNTYKSKDLLSSPRLHLRPDQIPQEELLSVEKLACLKKNYLSFIDAKYFAWRTNLLKKEVEEWTRKDASNGSGHFHTESPIILFKMVDENLKVAETVGPDVVEDILGLSLQMILAYCTAYEGQVQQFITKYFRDRSKAEVNFTEVLIAVSNNCLDFSEVTHQLNDKYRIPIMVNNDAVFESIFQTFENLREKAIVSLLHEAFLLDLKPLFQEIGKRAWIKSSSTTTTIDTICATLDDYFQDYIHLKKPNFDIVMARASELFVQNYLSSLLSRASPFKSQEKRKQVSVKIVMESEKVRQLFEKQSKCLPFHFHAIKAVAEVIQVEDLDILCLELHSFIKAYPDLTRKQLTALFNIRGDIIGRGSVKGMVSKIIPKHKQGSSHEDVKTTIFSKVTVTRRLLFKPQFFKGY